MHLFFSFYSSTFASSFVCEFATQTRIQNWLVGCDRAGDRAFLFLFFNFPFSASFFDGTFVPFFFTFFYFLSVS